MPRHFSLFHTLFPFRSKGTFMKTVDLHVHSNKSDGTLTPSQLVDLAVEKGLSAFALTDHDTTEGLEEAIAYAADKPVTVIPGIEFSTEYLGKDIHIVGLDIEYDGEAFKSQIQEFVDSRILRNQKMCRNLQEAGIDISYEKLTAAFRAPLPQEPIMPAIF